MNSFAEALRRAGLVNDEEVAKAEEVKKQLREADAELKLLALARERNPMVIQEKVRKLEKTYAQLERVQITRPQ